jgi:hypothetical protein
MVCEQVETNLIESIVIFFNQLQGSRFDWFRSDLPSSIAPEDCIAVGQFVTLSYEGTTTILLADCYSCGQLPPE